MPASDLVDGLAQMVSERQGPVLDMVREADGSIRWERHQHAGGDIFYMPRPSQPRPELPAETVRLVAQYDDIFSRFDDDTPAQKMGRL